MEGSDEESADRKYQKTDIGSAKAKYFAFLDHESSCSDDNSSQSEEDPYVKAKLMVATYLNEPKCKSDVCPLQVLMGQCQKCPEIATIALKYLSAPVSSVASEREFKVARDLANGSRTRLKPDNVEKLLFLKHNLKAIGYDSITLSDVRLTKLNFHGRSAGSQSDTSCSDCDEQKINNGITE